MTATTSPEAAGANAATAPIGVLTSPLFLVSVLALLANDFLFKRLYPGAVTGKASDFAGVFALALFAAAILPARRLAVHVVVAVGFIVWKSPLVQPLLDAWNAVAPLRFGRTVDVTDLVALAVLPFSYRYAERPWPVDRSRVLRVTSLLVALFAFAATSFLSDEQYSSRFVFAGSPDAFAAKLRGRNIQVFDQPAATPSGPAEYSLRIEAPDVCFGSIQAILEVQAQQEQTLVHLRELSHRCPRRGNEKVWLFRIFKDAVVVPLALKPA